MYDLAKAILRRVLPKKWYLQCAFKAKFGRWINFDQPESLNEKLQYTKVYGYRDIHRVIADKYAVRQYVKDLVGEEYLIPLIGVFRSHRDIEFSWLPKSFVAKSTNGSGQVIIVRDKSEVSEASFMRAIKKWLNTKFYLVSMEQHYRYIEPQIVIERLLLDENAKVPVDYKFHSFSGKVEMIQVDIDRFGDHRRNYYSSEWDRLPFNWTPVDKHRKPCYADGEDLGKPQRLNEMIKIAETLSADLGYIRVDLYECRNEIYFGELTLCHGGGFEPFVPDNYDYHYGMKYDISKG